MKLISVFVAEHYLARLDSLVTKGLYPNRNEAIRSAIRDLVQFHETVKETRK